jgi:DNA primase
MALDSSLFQEAEGKLNPEDFTSPFLGKVYGIFRQRWQEGRQIRVAAMAGELTQEEMNQLTAALQKPVSPGNVHEALRDYIDAIQLAKLRAGGESDDRILLAFRDKKANGGNHL